MNKKRRKRDGLGVIDNKNKNEFSFKEFCSN